MPEQLLALAAIFGSSFLIGLSGAVPPGPMFAATVAHSARGGFWAGPLIVLGHGALELGVVIGVSYGLASLLQASAVRGGIALGGAAMLLYMGLGLVRHVRQLSFEASAQTSASRARSFAAGVVTSLSNPYWSLWWASVGVSYINLAADQGLAGAVSFYTGHISADLSWFSLVALVASRGGRGALPAKAYRAVIIGCAAVMIGFGAYFGWAGVRWLSE